MSTYLIHSIYHRQLQPAELGTALEQGRGLLLVDAEGAPRFIENPLGMARKPKDELRKLWADACAEGRVYLAWATRWSADDALPALPVTVEPEAQGPQPACPVGRPEAATEALANA
jgi:hypothetical protein